VPLELLEPIPDPELSITEADIELQLCKRMISNPAALGLEIDSILRNMQTAGSPVNRGIRDDSFTMQEDYVSFSGLGLFGIGLFRRRRRLQILICFNFNHTVR
jgi:hypothetical protein